MACKEHFFVFGKERVAPTALGTHRVHCQHCGKNLYERLPEVLRSAETVGVLEGKMSLGPGGTSEPHLHVWEPTGPDTWVCRSQIFDKEIVYKNGGIGIRRKMCGDIHQTGR